jgi:hypothetical protein
MDQFDPTPILDRPGGHCARLPMLQMITHEKPKTKGANCERRHPGGNGIAAQSTEKPGGHRSHKPDASDQNRIVSHSALRSIPILPNDRGTALTSR